MYKSNLNPMFRSKFSEDIFNHKYRHEGAETWSTLAKTLVEDVCGDNMSTEDKDKLITYITDMKFLPGGRYLYYAGRANKFFNNCGVAETKLLTKEGWKTFGESVGKTVELLSPVDGEYKEAKVYSHGQQPVYDYI